MLLIEGLTEWTKAWFATGINTNLLQNGYNPTMRVSAMSLGPTVVITRYKDTDDAAGSAQCVLDQPTDTLILQQAGSNSNDVTSHYRLVAWSQGSQEKSLLAIASSYQVEIWEVIVSSGISATLKGSVDIDHLQWMSWNPCNEVLLACSKTDIVLIIVSQSVISCREIYTDSRTTYRTWGASSWSPSGLQVSIAQDHVLHCFDWTNVESLLLESPKHDQIDARTPLKGIRTNELNIGNANVGPIAAVARVSSTVCIFTTDTKLVVEDITRPDIAENMKPYLNGTGSASTLLLHPINSPCQDIREHDVASSSHVIDLTSIRVSASSIENSLQILNHVEDAASCVIAPHVTPCSHLLVVEYKAGKWIVSLILDLPYLTSPDVLVVQETQSVVGSSLSPRLIVVHMDVTDREEWTASVSGELELPPTHVCSGLYVAEKSSFVSVASTKKPKRATFFHAVAKLEPMPVYLSNFKLPERPRSSKPIVKQPDKVQKVTAIALDTIFGSLGEAKHNGGENKDLLDRILVKVMSMQNQLNTRFEDVDKKLLQLMVRVEQLERHGGTNK
ncbi:unnamed protein product [Peronospora destructor]|uniref:WD repeat and coiled-coil-containing protein n=1 Tax=Peronospora destructor TaxID=86335 RepID=A0AAV0UX82_9STRA|nr:unnamed protein product [Peronospora destructor]